MRIDLLKLLHLLHLLLSWRLTLFLLLYRHPREYVTIFYLSTLIPSPLNFSLVHLDHLLVAEILIMAALTIVTRGKE